MPYNENSRANLRQTTPKVRCDDCGNEVSRADTFIKRVAWLIPTTSRTIRSRSIKRQCVACVEKDPDYNREAVRDAPGQQAENFVPRMPDAAG